MATGRGTTGENTTEKIVVETPKVEDEHNTAGTAPVNTMHKKEYSGDVRDEYVNYAYQIGGEELVYLIECESATWNMYRKSYGTEKSYGFCQINQIFHPEIVNNDLFWSDPYWQLEQCNNLMKQGTPFYGRNRVVKGVKCSQYVKDRFYIE